MKRSILLLSALFFTSTGFTQHINLKKGQKFSVDNSVTAITTQMLMGQPMESNAEVITKSSIEVKDVKTTSYDLINTFTKMKMKVSAMGNNVNFDSDNKEDMAGEHAASFKDLINKPKAVTIDKTGKILNTVKDTATSSSPGLMKMMIDQLLGDPGETGYGVNVAFISIPGKISAGYSWTDSSGSEGIQRSTTYTVKEIGGNDAVISLAGILNTDVKAQMQGMDIVNKSKGKVTGEEIVDITTGVIKQRTTTLESAGTIQAQGFEIPMTTKITFVSTVKPA